MFSLAQASVSLRPFPPIAPTQAMFNLLFRFWPRKSVGTPNASAPAAREEVFIKSRRLTPGDETDSGEFKRGIVFDWFLMCNRIHRPGCGGTEVMPGVQADIVPENAAPG